LRPYFVSVRIIFTTVVTIKNIWLIISSEKQYSSTHYTVEKCNQQNSVTFFAFTSRKTRRCGRYTIPHVICYANHLVKNTSITTKFWSILRIYVRPTPKSKYQPHQTQKCIWIILLQKSPNPHDKCVKPNTKQHTTTLRYLHEW